MRGAIDISGQWFGDAYALRCVGGGRGAIWYCLCRCGKRFTCLGVGLRAGTTKSCGHLHFESGRKTGLQFGKRYAANYCGGNIDLYHAYACAVADAPDWRDDPDVKLLKEFGL